MNSKQYEELSRFFLSIKLQIDINKILSIHMPNPSLPNLPDYKHQIDLYWETGDELTKYLNIANVKWRSTEKVEQGEVLLLQQVKQSVKAHKAMMITNIGFTSGAIAVAKHEGISLHIVKPDFDFHKLSKNNSNQILSEIQNYAKDNNESVFIHESVHKAFEFQEMKPQVIIKPVHNPSTKIMRNVSTKVGGSGSTNKGLGSNSNTSRGSFGGTTKSGGFSKGGGFSGSK